MIIMGLDISTSCTGYCIMDFSTGKILEIDAIEMDDKDFFNRFDTAKEKLASTIKKWNVTHVAAEEFFKKFRKGSSSIDVIIKLAVFNSLVQYYIRTDMGIKVHMINVNDARKKLGFAIKKEIKKNAKEQVFDQVIQRLSGQISFPTKVISRGKRKGQIEYEKKSLDMSDAYVITEALHRELSKCAKMSI